MGSRLRFLIILIGAALVVATYTYPLWRPDPVNGDTQAAVFPELSAAQQQEFQRLPEAHQRLYLQMRGVNVMMALDLVRARLVPDITLPPDEQAPLSTDGAFVAAQGEFAPVVLDEDSEREKDPFSDLYNDTSGMVTIYQFADNSKYLRIENLDVHNGPNLRLVLSTLPDPVTAEELLDDRFRIDIGPLRANVGNLNYQSVPVEININDYNSLVIWDNTHQVIFGVAGL